MRTPAEESAWRKEEREHAAAEQTSLEELKRKLVQAEQKGDTIAAAYLRNRIAERESPS